MPNPEGEHWIAAFRHENWRRGRPLVIRDDVGECPALMDCSIVSKSSEEAIRNPGDYYLSGVRSKRRDSVTAWNGNRPGARLRPPEHGSLRRIPLGERHRNWLEL